MRHSRPMRHDSLLLSILSLSMLGSFVLVSGCDRGSANDRDSLPEVITESGSGSLPPREAKASNAAGAADPAPAGQSNVVSKIEGDRMQVIPREIVLSKQTESSPFRFAEIAKEAGHRFRPLFGHDRARSTSPRPTARAWPSSTMTTTACSTSTSPPPRLLPLGTAVKGPNRLYKNLGGNHFQDVTVPSGLGFRGFCHGIIAGDIDNDGDQDVFLCNYGSNVLYLNNGDGTFKDISKQAGIDAPNWSSGGAMLDYDNDGFLDIYVTNYGRWNYPDDHHPGRRQGEEGLALLVAPHDQDRQAPVLPQQRQPDVHRRLDKVITDGARG